MFEIQKKKIIEEALVVMKYLLKVELNNDCKPVFEKVTNVNSGNISYFARGNDGFIEMVDEQWVINNSDDILNLFITVDGDFVPVVVRENISKHHPLICSYEIDNDGVFFIAIASRSSHSDKVVINFYGSSDEAPEVHLYGIEADIDFTQDALEKFACEHISEHKWSMFENYYART